MTASTRRSVGEDSGYFAMRNECGEEALFPSTKLPTICTRRSFSLESKQRLYAVRPRILEFELPERLSVLVQS